jgi:hypothetical protein
MLVKSFEVSHKDLLSRVDYKRTQWLISTIVPFQRDQAEDKMNFVAILLLVLCWIYICPVAVVGVRFCISSFCGSVLEVSRSKTL